MVASVHCTRVKDYVSKVTFAHTDLMRDTISYVSFGVRLFNYIEKHLNVIVTTECIYTTSKFSNVISSEPTSRYLSVSANPMIEEVVKVFVMINEGRYYLV